MRVIWKYRLAVIAHGDIEMPMGADILGVGIQGSAITLWAMVDTETNLYQTRRIRVYGTGHNIQSHENLKHLGTLQHTLRKPAAGMKGREIVEYVWHVFEDMS